MAIVGLSNVIVWKQQMAEWAVGCVKNFAGNKEPQGIVDCVVSNRVDAMIDSLAISSNVNGPEFKIV